jgi:signal transduction histidine kinase
MTDRSSKQESSKDHVSLRAKAMLVGAVIGLVISVSSGFLTFSLARSYLTGQRESATRAQSFAHAQLVANSLSGGLEPFEALSSIALPSAGYRVLLLVGDEWISSGTGVSSRQLPNTIIESARTLTAVVQRSSFDGEASIFTVFPIQTDDSSLAYVGISQITELQETLSSIGRALLLGVGVSTVGGLFIGLWLSRRVMSPLRDISRTAVEISRGNLEARVTPPAEPDLAIIAGSFNVMADDLQTRLIAESRFAAHAAHELRSPLTAIKGATGIISEQSDRIPDDLIPTLRVLTERVTYFERLLQDLLILSRQASGIESANLTTRTVGPLFEAIASHLDISPEVVRCDPEVMDVEVLVDVQALSQVVGNLVRNAIAYAGAVDAIRIAHAGDEVIVHVEDSGPGFSLLERDDVLRPFQRGRLAPGVEGAGLGLSIADGLLKSMDSRLRIGHSPTGGAQCSFTLPVFDRETDRENV